MISTGSQYVLDGELVLIRFVPLRITKDLTNTGILDNMRPKFMVTMVHINCLTDAALRRIVHEGEGGSSFDESLYFHPNVRVDGWVEFEERFTRSIHDRPFPPSPQFWEHPAIGSSINRWPPAFFEIWARQIYDGLVLCLDPALQPVAGPSEPSEPVAGPSSLAEHSPNLSSSLSDMSLSPSPSPSPILEFDLSQPLETPPNSDEDGLGDDDIECSGD
jgi:hypothetical protein